MPEQTLADLMREVGIEPSAVTASTAQPRPPLRPQRAPFGSRPMPRQMRGAEARAADPRLAPAERTRAYGQVQRTQEPPRGEAYAAPRNQFAEAGQMAWEGTGVPAAGRAGEALRDRRYADAAWEGGTSLLALGSLGLPARGGPRAMPRAPRAVAEPMPAIRPPPRLPGRATDGSVLPVRPTEPFRNSLRGGSDDLMEAARPTTDAVQPNGARPTPSDAARGTRAVIDATPDYNPNNIAPAQIIRNPSEADIARLTRRPRDADQAHGPNHYNTLRWIGDKDGNIYVGNSFNFTHDDLVNGARRLSANIGDTVSGRNGTITRKGDGFVTYGVTADGAPLSRDWLAGRGVADETRLNDLTNELIDRGLYMHGGDREATARWVQQTVGSTPHGQEAIRRLRSLPSSDATRGGAENAYLAQLRDDGFDVDTPLFHGTGNEVIGALRPTVDHPRGTAVYTTTDPEMASAYADVPGGNVLPMYARGPIADDQAWHRAFEANGRNRQRTVEALQAQGYRGVRDGVEVAIWNPDDLAPRFRPAQSDGGKPRPPPDLNKSYRRPKPPNGGFLLPRRTH